MGMLISLIFKPCNSSACICIWICLFCVHCCFCLCFSFWFCCCFFELQRRMKLGKFHFKFRQTQLLKQSLKFYKICAHDIHIDIDIEIEIDPIPCQRENNLPENGERYRETEKETGNWIG
jgi:hypothetical protein